MTTDRRSTCIVLFLSGRVFGSPPTSAALAPFC